MMSSIRMLGCGAAAILAVAGCAGPRAGQRPPQGGPNAAMRPVGEREQNIRLMLSYDENSDGTVTRDELEAGLKRQFTVCDLNHDGRIDIKEMQAENDRRFRAFGTAASPLIDWNQNGQIDFDEFATTARSVFAELDADHDGKLDKNELRLPMPRGGPGMAPGGQQGGRGQQRRGGLASLGLSG
jgi:Ca2+-binding EF-hand superfamily protein